MRKLESKLDQNKTELFGMIAESVAVCPYSNKSYSMQWNHFGNKGRTYFVQFTN